VLVPRPGERLGGPAEVRASGREGGTGGDLQRRGQGHALKAVQAFEADYGAKWPKAVVKITEHVDVLLAFCDFPAEHWIHLRTTNPISVNRPERALESRAA
jgi:transposase-like protein